MIEIPRNQQICAVAAGTHAEWENWARWHLDELFGTTFYAQGIPTIDMYPMIDKVFIVGTFYERHDWLRIYQELEHRLVPGGVISMWNDTDITEASMRSPYV